jgi:hypothetical protein
MNRNPRNQHLLSQISETNPFKAELAHRIFAIGADFERAVEAVGQDRRLSQEGRKDAARIHLQKALRELDGLQKQVDAYGTETASMRSGIKAPTYDKSDVVAALGRQELRAASRAMTSGQRAAHLAGPTRSKAFVDALLEFADDAWMSGVDVFNPNEAELFEEARQSRLRDLNGPLMTALEARAGVESEIAMVIDIVRNDLESDATHLAARAA